MRQRTILFTILTVFVCLFAMAGTGNAKAIYVDDDVTGANDGTSWENAYYFLQDALMFAGAGDEIRVAQGVYRPDEFVLSKRPNLGREESFHLKNGVTLKGGYPGFGEPDPNARDTELYRTILSGDLNGDDVEVADACDLRNEPSRVENSYHVVTANEVDETAILDGFTISAGNANGPVTWPDYDYKNSQGGGVYINSGSPKFIDCTFEHNTARNEGGAIHSTFQSSPTLVRCAFKENAANTGGGMCSHWHYPDNLILVDCTFAGNVATLSGGGIHGYGTLTNCTLSGNRAPRGGGLRIEGDPTLTNCAFIGNLADVAGGGIYNLDTAGPTLVRCRFIENVAWQRDEEGYISGVGGGMYNDESNPRLISCAFIGNIAVAGGGMRTDYYPTFTNCVFSGNLSDQGGGLYIDSGWGIIALTNCTFSWNLALASIGNQIRCEGSSETVLMNCIFWGGTPFQANEIYLVGHPNPNITPTLTVNYSCIRGGKSAVYVGEQCTLKWGESNIDLDPCFADPGYWDPNDMPEDANDDFWVDGDYHLKSQAGRWDASEGRWMTDDVTSPCIDAGDPMSPIGDEPFPNGGIINMGAYGGTTEASKSYFGKPPCEAIVAGDINGDCEVNFSDLYIMALHWCEDHNL